jgi:hypothetical protein
MRGQGYMCRFADIAAKTKAARQNGFREAGNAALRSRRPRQNSFYMHLECCVCSALRATHKHQPLNLPPPCGLSRTSLHPLRDLEAVVSESLWSTPFDCHLTSPMFPMARRRATSEPRPQKFRPAAASELADVMKPAKQPQSAHCGCSLQPVSNPSSRQV